MALEDVLKDIKRELNRVRNATYLEAKKELSTAVYPLLQSTVEAIIETLDEFYEEMASDNVIHSGLAGRVFEALTAGQTLAEIVDQIVFSGRLDDLAKQRYTQALETWTNTAVAARTSVEDSLVDDYEEDNEDEDEDKEDDDSDLIDEDPEQDDEVEGESA